MRITGVSQQKKKKWQIEIEIQEKHRKAVSVGSFIINETLTDSCFCHCAVQWSHFHQQLWLRGNLRLLKSR